MNYKSVLFYSTSPWPASVKLASDQHYVLSHNVSDEESVFLRLTPEWLLVQVRVLGAVAQVEGGRNRRQELGAGEGEAGLELGQVAGRHLVHLLGVVLLLQHGVKGFVDALRVKDETGREQLVHLESVVKLFLSLTLWGLVRPRQALQP